MITMTSRAARTDFGNVDPLGESLTAARFESPLGPMIALASERGLCLLEWLEGRTFETAIESLGEGFGASVSENSSATLDQTARELAEYFDGDRTEFDVALDLRGSAHQKRVWERLLAIPSGQVESYGEIAQSLGSSARAVGRAVGRNPIAIMAPCHRVVGADGRLTGYAGGLWRKEWLLAHERGERRAGRRRKDAARG